MCLRVMLWGDLPLIVEVLLGRISFQGVSYAAPLLCIVPLSLSQSSVGYLGSYAFQPRSINNSAVVCLLPCALQSDGVLLCKVKCELRIFI